MLLTSINGTVGTGRDKGISPRGVQVRVDLSLVGLKEPMQSLLNSSRSFFGGSKMYLIFQWDFTRGLCRRWPKLRVTDPICHSSRDGSVHRREGDKF